MRDLKERFDELDAMPAPDLQRQIQTRVQRLEGAGRVASGAWLLQVIAAAAIVVLGIGLAVIFHFARISAPTKPAPSPPITPGVVAWVDRPAPAYSPPPQASPPPYPTSAARCLATQLRASAGPHGAAASNQLDGVTLTNVGPACLLEGRPVVTGLNASGQRVTLSPRPGTYFGPLQPADIAQGDHGYIYFGTADVCESAAEQPRTTEYRALAFDLPSGGRLSSQLTLSVGNCGLTMDDMGLPTPASPQTSPQPGTLGTLNAHVDLPATVRAGDTLRYTVVLYNPTATAVSLSNCPSYTEILGYPNNRSLRRGTGAVFMLNCDQVKAIPPGANVVYAMELKVPADAATGTSKFGWRLNDPDGPFAGGAVTIN
jgi:hypothetical protein